MPWPAGGAQRLRPRRGDPLADRGRPRVDRLIVAPRARDLRRPGRAPRRDLAGAGAGRAGRSSSSRTAPASGRAATSPPSAIGRPYSFGQLEALLRRHRLAPERHAAALYAPPVAPAVLAADGLFLGAHRPPLRAPGRRRRAARRGLQAGLRPPAVAGSKVAVPGPLEVLEGLAGPKPEPVARPRPPRSPPRGAGASRAAAAPRLRAHFIAASTYCHAPEPLLSPRRFRRGRGATVPRQDRTLSARGGPGSEQRKGVGGQLSFIDIRGSGTLRDGALRDRQGIQARSTRSRRDVPALEAALAESADLREMLASPVFTREEQGKAIAAIAAKMGLGPTVANTLGLMAQNRRLFVVPRTHRPGQGADRRRARRGHRRGHLRQAADQGADRGARRRRSRPASART